MSVTEKLQSAIDTLLEIQKSGYWPFASPAPCSTEAKIKNAINGALENLDTAMFFHKEMFERAKN